MKAPRSYVFLLMTLVGSAFIVGVLTFKSEARSSPTVILDPKTEIIEQSPATRVLRSPQWQLDYRLGEEGNSLAFLEENPPDFFNLVTARRGPDDSVYLLDSGDFSVKRVVGGEVVARYGMGEGSGPGEMRGPMDLAIDEIGQVWVADSVNGTITVFSADGEVLRTLRQEVPPARVVVGPEGQILTASPRGQGGIFSIHTSSGTRSFGKLVDKPQHAIAFGGWLESIDETLLYSPLYFGMLLSYDFSGNLLWAAETIDPVPPPPVVFRDDGLIMLDPKSQPLNYSLSANADYIFTLSRRRESGWKKRGVIDVYDRRTGRYHYSFPPPAPAKGILIAGNHLYTYTASELSRWRSRGGENVLQAEIEPE